MKGISHEQLGAGGRHTAARLSGPQPLGGYKCRASRGTLRVFTDDAPPGTPPVSASPVTPRPRPAPGTKDVNAHVSVCRAFGGDGG